MSKLEDRDNTIQRTERKKEWIKMNGTSEEYGTALSASKFM